MPRGCQGCLLVSGSAFFWGLSSQDTHSLKGGTWLKEGWELTLCLFLSLPFCPCPFLCALLPRDPLWDADSAPCPLPQPFRCGVTLVAAPSLCAREHAHIVTVQPSGAQAGELVTDSVHAACRLVGHLHA